MGWPVWLGNTLFFAVPAVLYVIVIAVSAARWGQPLAILGVIAGSDNRLSLSRLQAFAWTLVIFGGFAASMAVSVKITPERWVGIPAEMLELAGIAIASGVFSSLIAAQTDEAAASQALYAEIRTLSSSTAAGVSPSGKHTELVIWGVNLGASARARLGGSLRAKVATATLAKTSDPDLIAHVKDKGLLVPPGDLAVLVGALTPVSQFAGPLVVDTANGRAAYDITLDLPTIILGRARPSYELSDLFRDDKNPLALDLMKVQMFGWTALAILIYVIFFVKQLAPTITELPNVDPSIVALTGVSQAGYLIGKAVTGLRKSP